MPITKNSTKAAHHIQRVIFDLETTDQRSAYESQQKIKVLFDRCLAKALEKALDELCPNGTVYKIDKLNIEIGKLDFEKINEELLYVHFYDEIIKKLRLIHPEKPTYQKQEELALEEFVFFINNGNCSWRNIYADLNKLGSQVLLNGGLGAELFIRLFQDADHRKRLISQFDTEFITRLIFLAFINLDERFIEKEINTLGKVLEKNEALNIVLKVLSESNGSSIVKEEFSKSIHGAVKAIKRETGRRLFNENKLKISMEDNLSLLEEDESLYLNYAGIILLHPFLKKFFENFGLLENGNFKNEETAEVAVHLLYYLSTGKVHPEEPELLLFKVLCGWPLKKPVKKEITLPDGYIEMSESLLHAVIGHWEKIKNTSIDGLRGGFIQREGKLMQLQGQWQLTVEQKTIDILLDHLPWTISVIKLPWLQQPLWVNWR